MAATPTANYGYLKGAKGDTDWHQYINDTFDLIDADLWAEHAADGTHKAMSFDTSITVPDNGWIGLGAAKGRIVFDDQATDEINLMTCKVGIGIDPGDGTLHVHTATAGAVAAAAGADDLVVESDGATGISILAPDASNANLNFGSPTDDTGAYLRWNHDAGLLRFATSKAAAKMIFLTANESEAMRIDESKGVYIGDTANGDMTIGLTMNQAANDDEIFALKSTDVGHGYTDMAETDTYFSIRKKSAGQGGAEMRSICEDDTSTRSFLVDARGGTADTAKTQAAVGLVHFYVAEHDGANGIANVTANGNVFVVECRTGGADRSLFVVDEDGDLLADGGVASTNMVTLYDEYEDAHLVRAFDLARSNGRGIVKSKWDEFLKYNEATLVELGIMGDTVANGGLINVTRLQQLHNGAIWQGYEERQMLKETLQAVTAKLQSYERALLGLGVQPQLLEA